MPYVYGIATTPPSDGAGLRGMSGIGSFLTTVVLSLGIGLSGPYPSGIIVPPLSPSPPLMHCASLALSALILNLSVITLKFYLSCLLFVQVPRWALVTGRRLHLILFGSRKYIFCLFYWLSITVISVAETQIMYKFPEKPCNLVPFHVIPVGRTIRVYQFVVVSASCHRTHKVVGFTA